jgi:hypothetical protein
MATSTKARTADPPTRTRYEDDLYAWVQEQVALLQAGRVDEIDAANIAEELGDVGKSEFNSLASAVEIVLLHLIKWDQQPERRSRSWENSIAEHRDRIADILTDNPSLKRRQDDAVIRGYRHARRRTSSEMDRAIRLIAETCPYSWNDIASRPIMFDPEDA